MCNPCVVLLYCTCDSFTGASDVRHNRCRNWARVNVGVLSAEICVTACVSPNHVRVVVIFTKNDV